MFRLISAEDDALFQWWASRETFGGYFCRRIDPLQYANADVCSLR